MTLEELREKLTDALTHPTIISAFDVAIRERDAMRRDAERYLWLAEHEDADLYMENPGKELLDRAVDAAMASDVPPNAKCLACLYDTMERSFTT